MELPGFQFDFQILLKKKKQKTPHNWNTFKIH
jgi:hypothetical protein